MTLGAHVRWPVLGPEDRQAVLGVLDRGVLSGQFAPEVRGLEREFAALVGSRYAIATSSGTSALHIALAATGIQAGDEVIVPAFTFVATAGRPHQGARAGVRRRAPTFGWTPPGWRRRRPRTAQWCRSTSTACPASCNRWLTPPVTALLIEDAASPGARYRGRAVGTLGAAGCFSLQSSKSLACGEGGILITDDEDLFRRAHSARMFGEDSRPEDEASYDLAHALDGNRAYDSATLGWNPTGPTSCRRRWRPSAAPASPAVECQRAGHAELLTGRLRELPG